MKKSRINKLSVVLATRNEEENIARCLNAVKEMLADLPAQAGEIIVFDEGSEDKTREIAKRLGAKVYEVKHQENFHITKQKAIDKAKYPWVLQLDADEVVTPRLAREILETINMSDQEIEARKFPAEKKQIFKRHEKILVSQGRFGKSSGGVVAFLLPRLNFFLGEPLRHAGVYPDPAIRLIKKGKAYLPGKSVHEIMHVDGRVAWLFNDTEHHDSPTLDRYLNRLNRYTDLQATDFEKNNISRSYLTLFYYSSFKPFMNFMKLYLRHRGYKDSMRGFIWSALSSLHFTISYFKYWSKFAK